MTKQELVGMVILMDSQKMLIQTKRIRIYQRENMVEKLHFLPYSLEPFSVTMMNLRQEGTVMAEKLERLSDGQGGYDNYCDADGNPTHMVYCLPVSSQITQFSGDITVKLTLDYIDQEAQTSSDNDNDSAPEPTPIHYVLNTDDTVIPVLALADYYSVVPEESLSIINQKIAELDQKQKELEATAEIYDAEKADNLKLDQEEGTLYLTSHDKQVGDKIDLNDLGDGVSQFTDEGLVSVVL